MRRLTRGRAATDDEALPHASAASQPVGDAADAQPGDLRVPANGQLEDAKAATEQPTAVLPTAAEEERPSRDLPAGVDPAELAAGAPTSAGRGRVRRRLRYLRQVRELLLRDIGGFYYEAHRSEQGLDPHRRLLDAKAARLATLDHEVGELESRLGQPHAETVLRVPGIGGTCPHCGELHSSDARFCSRCGHSLTGRAARDSATSAPQATSGGEEKVTTASLWGRPKRPEPEPARTEATRADERPPTPPLTQRAGTEEPPTEAHTGSET
jgi:zinc-ribbon domain